MTARRAAGRRTGPARQRASSTSRRCPVVERAGLRAGQVRDAAHLHGAADAAAEVTITSDGDGRELRQHAAAGHACLAPEGDVLGDRQRVAELDPLERPPEAPAGPAGGAEPVTSSPCRRDLARIRRLRPLMASNVVVLPAPFGPISPVIRCSGDLEAEVVHRDEAAEAHTEVRRPRGPERCPRWSPGGTGTGVETDGAGARPRLAPAEAFEEGPQLGRHDRVAVPWSTITAKNPNSTFSQYVVFVAGQVGRGGRRRSSPAGRTTASANGATASRASRISENRGMKWASLETAKWIELP